MEEQDIKESVNTEEPVNAEQSAEPVKAEQSAEPVIETEQKDAGGKADKSKKVKIAIDSTALDNLLIKYLKP